MIRIRALSFDESHMIQVLPTLWRHEEVNAKVENPVQEKVKLYTH